MTFRAAAISLETAEGLPTALASEDASETLLPAIDATEGGSELTLEEVGKRFTLTRERIRQIEDKALRKLRNPLRSATLRAFVE